jgi:hypothetical protein
VGNERGQASVDWAGVLLIVALALGALAVVTPPVDGRSYGGFLTHRLFCAVRGGCDDGDAALADAYGERDAALVRAHAPNLVYEPGERQLPVDYRRCRRPGCADAPDDPDLDAHRTGRGERATVFTRVIRREGRTYIQYWLYYPDSKTVALGSDKAWEAAWLLPRLAGIVEDAPTYPGLHRDDWESFQVRLDPDGEVWVRSSSHGHYQGCKWSNCRNRWYPDSGWTRVSRGSHAGHIPAEPLAGGRAPGGRRPPVRVAPLTEAAPDGTPPAGAPSPMRHRRLLPGRDLHERTTTSEGLRLIPLETRDKRGYRRLDEGIKPPWDKAVYDDPESDES